MMNFVRGIASDLMRKRKGILLLRFEICLLIEENERGGGLGEVRMEEVEVMGILKSD